MEACWHQNRTKIDPNFEERFLKKNVFLVEMAAVDLDQKFVGLDITFYDQKDHTHSHRYGHRIGCLKNKVIEKN